MPRVLVTVPHKPCPPVKLGHLCDTSASPSAKALVMALEERGIEAILLEATIHRDSRQLAADGLPGRDQNRPWGRGTDFRDAVVEASAGATHLIDMHSFPPGRGLFEEATIAILDPRGFLDRPTPYALDALGYVKRALPDDRVVYVKGSTLNDIVMSARSRGLTSFLVENREGISESKRREIAAALAGWIAGERTATW